MKNKLFIFIIAIFFELFVLTGIVTYTFRIKKAAIKNGTIVVLKCKFYDPYNPFKGRYVRLNLPNDSPYKKTHNKYYLNESYANIVDSLNWGEQSEMEPELELYVDQKGRAVQKSLTVLVNNQRITIEEYCKNEMN